MSAPLLFSQLAMRRLAAQFALRHREVQLEVTSEDRPFDMVEESYDLAIRVNPDPDESLVGRVFLRDRLVVMASPDLRRPVGGAAAPAVVRSGAVETTSWDLVTRGRRKAQAVTPVLRLPSLFMVRDAVRARAGAAVLPVSLVANDLDSGRLVRWGDLAAPPIELWACTPHAVCSARASRPSWNC